MITSSSHIIKKSRDTNITDYQGNIRQVVNPDGEVLQDNHYYPFGMLMGESSDIVAANLPLGHFTNGGGNRFRYGAKELITTGGVNLSDYTARYLDHATLRFLTPDPLREKYTFTSSYIYCRNNPIIFIDPSGCKPTVLESALMCLDSYHPGSVKLQGGWKMVVDADVNQRIRNEFGYDATLYARYDDYGNILEYALAIAGTDEIIDWAHDLLQLIGESTQYKFALKFAKYISERFKSDELTFLGHSLGGGEAIVSGLGTGRDVITFNPASLSRETLENLSLVERIHVENYIVKDEIVDIVQRNLGMETIGDVIYLDNHFKTPKSWKSFIPNVKFKLTINGKSMLINNLRDSCYNHIMEVIVKILINRDN